MQREIVDIAKVCKKAEGEPNLVPQLRLVGSITDEATRIIEEAMPAWPICMISEVRVIASRRETQYYVDLDPAVEMKGLLV